MADCFKTVTSKEGPYIVGDKIEIKLNNPLWHRGWLLRTLGELYRRYMEYWVFPRHPELRNIRTITRITDTNTLDVGGK